MLERITREDSAKIPRESVMDCMSSTKGTSPRMSKLGISFSRSSRVWILVSISFNKYKTPKGMNNPSKTAPKNMICFLGATGIKSV